MVVDLDAIAANTALLRERVAPLMAVVKADGYGHGLLPVCRAVLAGGADALGVAVLEEALALRAAGITAPLLAWLHAPGTDFAAALAADVEVSVNAEWSLTEVVGAARTTGRTAACTSWPTRGSRGGRDTGRLAGLVAAAARAQADGAVAVVGLWSHMTYADAPTHPSIAAQVEVFEEAAAHRPRRRAHRRRLHLANSAATVALPSTWYDFVRPGVALYGLDPLGGPDPAAHGLRPAMTVRAPVALTKRVPAGSGVSYGHAYVPDRETTLALVPVGYADGVPRAAGNRAPVLAAGAHRIIAGRVCMDQFVLDVGDATVAPGDPVVLWGPGDAASRRRSSGPTCSTPSTTSSSRGSAAASPGATSARRGRSDGGQADQAHRLTGAISRIRSASSARSSAWPRPGRRGGRLHVAKAAARRVRPRSSAPAGSTLRRRSCARTIRWVPRPGRPTGRRGWRTDDGVLLAVDEIEPDGPPADRRLRARLHALDGLLDLPAADPGRRAGHRERPPARRPAGLLRPARARRSGRARRALDDRSARAVTSPRCSRPGCRAGRWSSSGTRWAG